MFKVSEFFTTKRIVFGIGAIDNITTYLSEVGARNTLVVTDKFLLDNKMVNLVTDSLDTKGFKYGIFTDILPNPTQENAEDCAKVLKEGGYESIIAFGGGSSMDVAKGGAVLATNPFPLDQYVGTDKVKKTTLPIITIPTTAGTGSEVSNISILKNSKTNVKAGIVSPKILPTIAIIDPRATYTMPAKLTAATGMDALCHAIEGYSSLKGTPFTDMYYEKAIQLIAANLRTAVANGLDVEARHNMSLGATFAGIGMSIAFTGAVHAMSYGIESKYKAHHGESCAALLPSVMKVNALANPAKYKKVAELLGENIEGLSIRDAALKAAEAVETLAKDIKIPRLHDLGMTEDDIEAFSEIAYGNKRLMDNNPWRVTFEDVVEMYRDALV